MAVQTVRNLLNDATLGQGELISVVMEIEARRRGLSITPVERSMFVADHRESGNRALFYRSCGSSVTRASELLLWNKVALKTFLRLTTAASLGEWRRFSRHDYSAALAFAKELNFDVVLKPVSSSKGRGFTGSVVDAGSFTSGWRYTKRHAKRSGILVERRFRGSDYRLYVVDGQVAAVLQRFPARIRGDGISSVRALIEAQNRKRLGNPYTRNALIEIDDEVVAVIGDDGYAMDDVLQRGCEVEVRKNANVSSGGSYADVTEHIHHSFVEIAREIAGALLPMKQFGLDIITKDIKSPATAGYLVTECEGDPGFASLHFPLKGTGRNIAGRIIRTYFPDVNTLAFGDGLVGESGIDYDRMIVGTKAFAAANAAVQRVMKFRP
jgi:cyanophycin synthetase